MKRWIWILLACLLLTGCASAPEPEQTVAPTETEAAPPTEPAGCYEPGSDLEKKTGGAVRRYPLQIPDSYALVTVGKDVVVFSGLETTTLTMLSGENLFVTARAELDRLIYPEQSSTQVTSRGISYYSADTGEIVLLDTVLKEVARIAVPGGTVGSPVMSADRQKVYYCTEEAVRVLDLETGISRLLMEIRYAQQSAESLLLNETVLKCRFTDEDGGEKWLFISTKDGSLLREIREDVEIVAPGDHFYAVTRDGAMRTLVFGNAVGEELNMLLPKDVTAEVQVLPELNSAVTAAQTGADTALLEYYTLSDGRRSSVLELENSSLPLDLAAMPAKGWVYVLCTDTQTGSQVVCRWDVSSLETNDGEIYTCPRYTGDAPDTEGLAECREYAASLSQLYGVEILLYTDATAKQPEDYTLQPEYQVPLIRRELEKLSWMLSAYPEGFLAQAAENTAGGVIRIALVRSIVSQPVTGLAVDADGIQYWVNEQPYVALAVGRTTEKTLYHNLFHAIEAKVYADSQLYYEWDKLNPQGFAYDYNYTDWILREDSEYLADENRAFIDSFSMSFPREDRARIMEYAMTEGNESYFQSETMQEKLHTLCQGIRKAFGLTKSEEVYLWEQYLNESLAYVPKQ